MPAMRLAVIGTFHRRHENTFPLMHRLFVDGTRRPDETWLMVEDEEDAAAVVDALRDLRELELLKTPVPGLEIVITPTPRTNGRYDVIPYSNKINLALNHTAADMIVYLDNGSMPSPEKYEVMAGALEANPGWGAVYCTQKRCGYLDELFTADKVIPDAFSVLNYTQVMHRRTGDRWTLDMAHADPDRADAMFWRDLHKSLGPFHPAGGPAIHDVHDMPSPAAQGVR